MSLINDTYNTLRNLFQKHDRGFLSVDEFNDGARYVQSKIIREAYDFLNNIKNQKKIGRVGKIDYDKETYYKEVVRQLLAPGTSLTYDPSSETFDFPTDYSFMQALYYSVYEINEISNDLRMVLMHPDTAPTEIYPFYLLHSDNIEIIPDSITKNVTMYYYRNAKDPKYTYEEIGGKVIFNESAPDFQDFDIPRSIFDLIIVEMALYFGIQLKMADVAQIMDKEDSKNEQLKRAE